MNYGQLVAFYYCGLLIFGLNGLMIMYYRAQAQKNQQALERAERLIAKHIRKKRSR